MNYVDRFRANLASGNFDPQTASPEDIRTAQLLVGAGVDGVWGPKSNAALEGFQKSYDGPMKFRWKGMEGGDAAKAYSAWDTNRIELEEKIRQNERRIEELKQAYLSLQQEHETTTEDLERNIATNRAGIGDVSQYNAWRTRVEARDTQKNAMKADSEAVMRQANTKVNNALRDLSYARGDKETAIATDIYKDALAEYNEKARELGFPEKKENEMYNEKPVTMFDTKDFIRQHRNSKGQWDNEENKQKAYDMAKALGDEGVQLLDEIYGQTTKGKAAADRKSYDDKLLEATKELIGMSSGKYTLNIDGKAVDATVQNSADGNRKQVIVDGKIIREWEVK